MRPRILTALAALLIGVGVSAPVTAEAPLCALSPDFDRLILSSDAVLGAAVVDLQTGMVWSGGHPGPYAMHSVIKPPIAWAVLSNADDNGREPTKKQREALFDMVTWSKNEDVNDLLGLIGGLPGLTQYYQRWGAAELAALTHQSRWGLSQAEPAHLARLYAALATSDAVPNEARWRGFDLLYDVEQQQRWGATIPEAALPGWQSLIKTGNYTLPEEQDADPDTKLDPNSEENDTEPQEDVRQAEAESPPDSQAKSEAVRAGETPLESQASPRQPLVRMNSAAIWVGPPWQGSTPRYVVTIMQEGFLSWSTSRALQDQIGEALANAIVRRETGIWSHPSMPCLRQVISPPAP